MEEERSADAFSSRENGSAWKRVNWARVFAGEIVADHLFLRSGLIRKDLLPLYAPSMPWTAILKDDTVVKYPDGALNPKGRCYECGWVLKPSDSSNGWGVKFFNENDDIIKPEKAKSNWILQRCINTQKLDGHIFHIRALLLIVGDIEAYLFDDARILLAVGKNRITNKSHNENLEDYDPNFHNRSLRAEIANGKLDPALFRSMRDICAKLLARLDDHLITTRKHQASPRNTTKKRHFFTLPNTYELFGLDFMLDQDNSNLLLLEANPMPSMAMWGTQGPPEFVPGDTLRCPITSKLGVPRSTPSSLGFTQVYSRRLRLALAALSSRSSSFAPSAPEHVTNDN